MCPDQTCRFVCPRETPCPSPDSAARDEAHRFATHYHQKLRKRRGSQESVITTSRHDVSAAVASRRNCKSWALG